MRVGFLVWNRFQVAHTAEIAKRFNEPDFIFIDRTPSALKGFDPAWLVPYGAYTRFVSELGLSALDGKYDAIVSQFRPPLKSAWKKTKLVMQQYSLAKPKTAYNARWFAADLGLVYGGYSESIIGQMCPVSQVGNPRFDPYFAGALQSGWLEQLRAKLDPAKKTILYLPTWGDLSRVNSFGPALSRLSEQFNIILNPHHLTPLRDRSGESSVPGLIDVSTLPGVLDPGLYLMAVSDLVISDMSGAIFDALYCRRPVVLIGNAEGSFSTHKKADDTALEVSRRDHIGPYVTCAEDLEHAVYAQLAENKYLAANESLVEECFGRRGGGASLAAAAIRDVIEDKPVKPLLQVYAAPDFSSLLLSRAEGAARKRKKPKRKKVVRRKAQGGNRTSGFTGRVGRWLGGQAGTNENKVVTKSRSVSLAALVKGGDFFAAGRRLEGWSRLGQSRQVQLIYQAQNAVTALRFSRLTWKRQLGNLFESIRSSSTESAMEVLKKLGMLRSAEAWYRKSGAQVPEELGDRLESLGLMAGVLDIAARNEVVGVEGQLCITPSGEVRDLGDIAPESKVELHLLASLARDLKDEDQRPYRQSLLQFSRNLTEQILGMGVVVYPRLQSGVVGATAVSADGVAFTWHTRDFGRANHFHLKIGTLYGHFILDGRGYSGWSSIARTPLPELIANVAPDAADAHWKRLHQDLVLNEKSKYSQAEESLPEHCKDFIFLPMQVSDDAVAELAQIDTLSLLNAVIEWARSRAAMVVVKRHPMCRDKQIARAIREAAQAGDIIVSVANIHRIIAESRGVVTVNSGVGAEALLQLKPVITTGLSDYGAATKQVQTIEELFSAMDALGRGGIDADDVKKFLWVYTNRYMVRYDDREAIRARLRDLLPRRGEGAFEPGSTGLPEIEGVASVPFLSDGYTLPEGGDGSLTVQEVALGEQCDQLLSELRAAGVKCWLDSGSLLGLIRHGRLNNWEKDIDLGIWIDDFESARVICRALAEKFSLWYREKWVGDVPYALLLSSHAGQKQSTLPISIHTFYRIGGTAWLPQPYSLVAARAKYPRYIYREVNGPGRAPLRGKISFLARNPGYSLSIIAEKMGMTRRIGRELKRIGKEKSLKERVLTRIFTETFQWSIPAHYFDELRELNEDNPHVLIPEQVDDYLRQRYGHWRVPVKTWFYIKDDGCISPTVSSELKIHLESAKQQYFVASRRNSKDA